MNITVDVKGLQGVEDALAAAGPSIAKKALRKALNAGAAALVEAVKSRAPILKEPHPDRKPGDLRDSIGAVIQFSPREQSGTAHIGPMFPSTGGSQQSPAVYGLFEEFGNKDTRPDPYMRPGFDAAASAAQDAFVEEIRRGVVEALTK